MSVICRLIKIINYPLKTKKVSNLCSWIETYNSALSNLYGRCTEGRDSAMKKKAGASKTTTKGKDTKNPFNLLTSKT